MNREEINKENIKKGITRPGIIPDREPAVARPDKK